MRNERVLGLIVLVLLVIISLSGCSNNQVENSNIKANNSTALTIENIDFKNFTYTYPNAEKRIFTLTNGEKPYGKVEDISFKLSEVSYADLTKDENKEAIVSIQVGLAVSNRDLFYVYSIKNNEPQILWSFWTCDTVVGCLKKAYSENGNLIIETFGNNKFENGNWKFTLPENRYEDSYHPTSYTKIVFKWNGEKFVPFGERQVFDYEWKKDHNKKPDEN